MLGVLDEFFLLDLANFFHAPLVPAAGKPGGKPKSL